MIKNRQGRFQDFAQGGARFSLRCAQGGAKEAQGCAAGLQRPPLKPHLDMYFHNKILGPLNVFCQIFLQMFQQEGLIFFYNQFHLNQICSLNFPYLYILRKHLQTSSHVCIFT